MKIKIKRFDKNLPLPEYKTSGAVCMDLYCRENVTIEAHSIGFLPLNVAVEVPVGYWTLLAARSSTHKLGLIPANGIGIIDPDYKGDLDELKLVVYNFTNTKVVVEKQTRVAQFMVLNIEKMEIEEVDFMDNVSRGGFGTTGK